MTDINQDEIRNYLRAIERANNEEVKRQRFVTLLSNLFGGMDGAKKVIDDFIDGAEQPITKIKKIGKKSERGRADTQYNSVIIEFENSLEKTGLHAIDQLAEYVSGNWNSGESYNFTLIATDCITWKIYSPNIESLDFSKEIFADDIELIERETFVLTNRNLSEFYYFLDSILFSAEKKAPSLKAIKEHFGEGSSVFLTASSALEYFFQREKQSPTVKVAYEQWKRFLSIAYDKFDSSESVFITHTYLSIFSKLLTYEVLTQDEFIDEDELRGVLDGSIFERLNIKNFTDNDFFHWVSDDTIFKNLTPMFRKITGEFDNFDFSKIDEDILKGVYQDLIDRDTRHSLGEYYTPDWLCELIVAELQIESSSKILDPSCGSGSFLRAAIKKLECEKADLSASQIASQVCGFDIHPLSVQISKATVLIALKDKIKVSSRPITLSIFLANTLLTPVTAANLDLFGDNFDVLVDKEKISLNTKIFDDTQRFEEAVRTAGKLADHTKGKANFLSDEFNQILKNRLGQLPSNTLQSCMYDIYLALKKTKEAERDSIWEFILTNLYKPCFLRHSFDFVVGNPPWFTMKNITNKEYQEQLKDKAKDSGVWPEKVSNAPHLEIASVFLAHCTEYFLNDKGKLAFVLPKSFYYSDHHHNTRAGEARHVRILELWDLEDVTPLFNVPSCVFITERARGSMSKTFPKSGRPGKKISGRLKDHNSNLAQVESNLKITDTQYFFKKLGSASAFSDNKNNLNGIQSNAYKEVFSQGATIVPRNFYFIEPTQEVEGSLKGRIFTAQTSEDTNRKAKSPWKDKLISGRISGDYVFYTALAENLLPFHLYEPHRVVLPLKIKENSHIALRSSEDFLSSGDFEMAEWFNQVESTWEEHKTAKSKTMSNLDRLNYSRDLTSQNFLHDYLVVYNASGKDANSTVIQRSRLDLPIIIDHKAYLWTTNNFDEANYVCAFLNSQFANLMIKEFQSRGLFGVRDIHKVILDVGLEKYQPDNQLHVQLASISKECHAKVSGYIIDEDLPPVLPTHLLGKQRLGVRKFLNAELVLIDDLLREMHSR